MEGEDDGDDEDGEAATEKPGIHSWAKPIHRPDEQPTTVLEKEEIRKIKHNLAEFKAEVGAIRELLEESRTEAEAARLPAGKRDVLRFLKVRGVREEHARGICNTANNVKEIPRAMAAGMAVREGDKGGKKVVVLVGPPGVGKTTTVPALPATTDDRRRWTEG